MMPLDHHDQTLGLAYRIPRVHAIGDWVTAILAILMLTPLVFGIFWGVLFGALGLPLQLAYVAVLVSLVLSAWCVLRFARGKVGPEWRLGVHGIERGTGWFRRCVPYERVRVIMMGEPGSPPGLEHRWSQMLRQQRAAGNAMLTVRLDRGVLSIYLNPNDSLNCFESLRQLCPHAGAIDIDGQSVGPIEARIEDRNDPPLAKEWRRRGWQGLGLILLWPFVGILLVTGLRAAFPGASSRSVITGVVVFFALLAIGMASAVIRAFREARRCCDAARRGNDQQS